jgi:hypothetical protein
VAVTSQSSPVASSNLAPGPGNGGVPDPGGGCTLELRRAQVLFVGNARIRDPRFGLSQISWRTNVAHHPTEDTGAASLSASYA